MGAGSRICPQPHRAAHAPDGLVESLKLQRDRARVRIYLAVYTQQGLVEPVLMQGGFARQGKEERLKEMAGEREVTTSWEFAV